METCQVVTMKYEQEIQAAVDAIKQVELNSAKQHLINALSIDFNRPEAENLMGIIEESIGNLSNATVHYRASYALNPMYSPARNNLERITEYGKSSKEIDFGDV